LYLLNGHSEGWRKDVFIQISESQIGRTIRTKKWKYSVKDPHNVRWSYSSSDIYVEEYFYDLENDMHEKRNLVNDSSYNHVKVKLASRLKKIMNEAGETVPKIAQ
jgi:hypothetical protein